MLLFELTQKSRLFAGPGFDVVSLDYLHILVFACVCAIARSDVYIIRHVLLFSEGNGHCHGYVDEVLITRLLTITSKNRCARNNSLLFRRIRTARDSGSRNFKKASF